MAILRGVSYQGPIGQNSSTPLGVIMLEPRELTTPVQAIQLSYHPTESPSNKGYIQTGTSEEDRGRINRFFNVGGLIGITGRFVYTYLDDLGMPCFTNTPNTDNSNSATVESMDYIQHAAIKQALGTCNQSEKRFLRNLAQPEVYSKLEHVLYADGYPWKTDSVALALKVDVAGVAVQNKRGDSSLSYVVVEYSLLRGGNKYTLFFGAGDKHDKCSDRDDLLAAFGNVHTLDEIKGQAYVLLTKSEDDFRGVALIPPIIRSESSMVMRFKRKSVKHIDLNQDSGADIAQASRPVIEVEGLPGSGPLHRDELHGILGGAFRDYLKEMEFGSGADRFED